MKQKGLKSQAQTQHILTEIVITDQENWMRESANVDVIFVAS